MNRHRLIRNLVLVCFVAGIAVATCAAAITRLADDSPSPAPIKRGRWMNVTYPLTVRFESRDGAREVAIYGIARDFDQTETIAIRSDPDTGSVAVDGSSGRVLKTRYEASDPDQSAFIGALRRALRYEPFSPGNAPWPYTDRPPPLGEAIATPEPLSGIQTALIADSHCGTGDVYRNWRSYVIVCPDGGGGGSVEYFCDVHEADRRAFSHLVAQYVPDGEGVRRSESGGADDCTLIP